jgi:hypothetical protein
VLLHRFVFEPNNANTWVKVKAMIENFLTTQWRAGALMGSKPDEAFYVLVGLGETMDEIDINEWQNDRRNRYGCGSSGRIYCTQIFSQNDGILKQGIDSVLRGFSPRHPGSCQHNHQATIFQ